MTEQLSRRQLRAARQTEVSTPEEPGTPSVAGDNSESVTSISVETDSPREFHLSAAFADVASGSSLETQQANQSPTISEPVLSPDELLRKFRERIRSNYQEGSIPIPQAKLPDRVSNPPEESYSFDINSIRERLRAAAEAARLQNQAASSATTLLPPEQHESVPIGEISEFDIAARQSATTLHVEALRESFAGLAEAPALESVTPISEDLEDSSNYSRRDLRRQVESENIAAPFSPEAEGLQQVNEVRPPAADVFATETTTVNVKPESVDEVTSANFQGKNLLAEPSTQSIVLDVIPDAVTMPINMSNDGLATGSISIIPEQSVSDVTGAIAGIKTDESTLKDTVTGAVSAIEPVSALAVIAERRHHAVLPMTSLRRGWWQPYAVAVGIFAMIGASAYAVFLILEVLNS